MGALACSWHPKGSCDGSFYSRSRTMGPQGAGKRAHMAAPASFLPHTHFLQGRASRLRSEGLSPVPRPRTLQVQGPPHTHHTPLPGLSSPLRCPQCPGLAACSSDLPGLGLPDLGSPCRAVSTRGADSCLIEAFALRPPPLAREAWAGQGVGDGGHRTPPCSVWGGWARRPASTPPPLGLAQRALHPE